jgi:hypothetical protein
MGVEIKLSDRELPVSPVFIDYLHHVVADLPFEGGGWDARRPENRSREVQRLLRSAAEHAARVLADPRGQRAIARAYELFVALLTGDVEPVKDLQLRFHFVNVIGVPRSGGTYLTQELFRALGHRPEDLPPALAHDGFPEAGPFRFERGLNSWVMSLQSTAEYLAMVEIHFGRDRPHSGRIVVPKKLGKAGYAGAFFHHVLGQAAEHILTLRHPVRSCISTYEHCGGLPADGRFRVRGSIEEWVRRDLCAAGASAGEVAGRTYFDAYLRYWELYHYQLATSGLGASRGIAVVAFGKERMEETVRGYRYRFGEREPRPEAFAVSDERARHPDWMAQAEPAIRRVAELWARVGLEFPYAEVMEAW